MKHALKILQLTDLHLFKDKKSELVALNPFQTLRHVTTKILSELEQNRPDLIMLTGDISQDDSLESYQTAVKITQQFQCPTIATMGNHDNFEHFKNIFGDATQLVTKPNMKNWRIIVLNSFWEQHVGGKLNDYELNFLQKNLADSLKQSVIIFLHHHVLPVDSTWIDKINLSNSPKFLEIIDQYQNIKAVVCGHIHQDTHIIRQGVSFYSSPSTCWQFLPKNSGFKLDTSMPGYRWITLNEDGSMQTEVVRIEYNSSLEEIQGKTLKEGFMGS